MPEVDGAIAPYNGVKAWQQGQWTVGIKMVQGTGVGDAAELGHFDNSGNFIVDAVVYVDDPGGWQNQENAAGGGGKFNVSLVPKINNLLRQLYPAPVHPGIIQNSDPYTFANQGALMWEWFEFYDVGDGTIGYRPRSAPRT